MATRPPLCHLENDLPGPGTHVDTKLLDSRSIRMDYAVEVTRGASPVKASSAAQALGPAGRALLHGVRSSLMVTSTAPPRKPPTCAAERRAIQSRPTTIRSRTLTAPPGREHDGTAADRPRRPSSCALAGARPVQPGQAEHGPRRYLPAECGVPVGRARSGHAPGAPHARAAAGRRAPRGRPAPGPGQYEPPPPSRALRTGACPNFSTRTMTASATSGRRAGRGGPLLRARPGRLLEGGRVQDGGHLGLRLHVGDAARRQRQPGRGAGPCLLLTGTGREKVVPLEC